DQIARWYRLKRPNIDRIDFDDSFDQDDFFVMVPSHVTFHGRRARRTIYPDSHPLTLIGIHQSPLLTDHVTQIITSRSADWRTWVKEQIASLVEEHERADPEVDERDLLRSSGALHQIGIRLGMYHRTGIDCPDARFQLDGYPEYACPIEVE